MRKSIAAATMAASLTVGGAAGAVLFTPTLSGAQTDETTETDETTGETGRFEGWLTGAIDPLVTDGTITQPQADAVIGAIQEAAPERGPGERHRARHARHVVSEVVLDTLGMTADELRTALSDGATLREVAEAQGVDPQVVVDALVAEGQERLDAAVAAGRMTQEEADEKTAELAERAESMLDRTFSGRDGGPRAGGDDAADDAEATDS